MSSTATPRRPTRRASISFGLSGDKLVPAEVSQILGIAPSWQFAKGDVYISRAGGERKRPWGVWAISSEEAVESLEIEDHAQYLLSMLEPLRDAILKYTVDPTICVEMFIWWEPEGGKGGYTLSSATLRRLADLCQQIYFSFA